jgi:prophage antirepressor-like protein
MEDEAMTITTSKPRRVAVERPVSIGEPLLRLADVARWLGLSKQTVRALASRPASRGGGLKSIRVANALRFRRQWVEDFIDRRPR